MISFRKGPILLSLAFVAVLGLSGCTSVASFVAQTATSLSSSTPSQVTTLAEAYQAATLVTTAADIAVNSGKLTRPQLLMVQALRGTLRTALNTLQDASNKGQSLDYAAFDAALQGWNSYATAQGIAH